MESFNRALEFLLGLSATRAGELTTFQVCVRAVAIYLILIAFIRIGKKRFLGKATVFDAILVIVIGSLASRGISGNAPFVASLASVLVLILAHWLMSYFAKGSPVLSWLIKGTDTLILKDSRIDRGALREAHMSEDDLAEDLRQKGIEQTSEVKEARLERSGKLSVIKK
jgi:uncharacterized membrane protein YcaP (DUF421 family)